MLRQTKRYAAKVVLQLILFTGLFIGGCESADTQTASVTETKTTTCIDDKGQIKQLIRNMYRWHEKDNSPNDMVPLKDSRDSFYIGIDIEKHKLRIDELKHTQFFSARFIGNYDKIVKEVDRKLKSREYIWAVGDLPPFGNDNDPWTNTQDVPYDNPWDNLVLRFVSLDGNQSTVQWTWGNSEWAKEGSYTVGLVKVNGTWQIGYMQGFNFEEYVK